MIRALSLLVCFSFLNLQAQQELKIISYNIRSVEPDFNVSPHIDFIKKEQPDIVAYQEVETRTSRMNNRDLILEIASRTGMFTFFSPAYKKSDGQYGNAILSKYPIINASYKLLPLMKDKGGSDQRVALVADIAVSNNDVIRFINVHLDHKLPDDGKKYNQFSPVLEFIKSDKKIILAGDFNAFSGGNIISKLKNDFDVQNGEESTFHGGGRIDYIMSYPKNKWTKVSSKVDHEIELSDHYPVISVLKLQ